MALRALVTWVAVACCIVAVAVVKAVVLAYMQRAVEPHKTLFTLARLVDRAHSVSRAVARAVTRLACDAVVSCLAQTDAVLASPMAVAV